MTIRIAAASSAGVATIDTTGMTFIAMFMATVGAQTPSASPSLTFNTSITHQENTVGMRGKWVFVVNPAATSTTHQFSQSQVFSSVFVIATDEVDVSGSPLDVFNGAVDNGNVSTLACGSLTTTGANRLLLAGIAHAADSNSPTSAYSIDNSFTLDRAIPAVTGVLIGGAIAHKIVTATVTGLNPAFSWTGANPTVGVDAAFAMPSGGGGGTASMVPRKGGALRTLLSRF